MTRRLGLVLALAVGLLVCLPTAAGAACTFTEERVVMDGTVQVRMVQHCTSTAAGTVPPPAGSATPIRDSGLDSICVRTSISLGLHPEAFCQGLADDRGPDSPELTSGLVAAAFRELVLPAAELVVQPPGGRTLVNFETNFFTEQGELHRTVSVLGREVELRIRPAAYDWRFGDGGSRVTTEPGSAYPDLEVTHRYLRTGRVAPSVAVTYAARFRVGDGAWRPVAGTVTVPGEPQPLRVVEARPVLVGH